MKSFQQAGNPVGCVFEPAPVKYFVGMLAARGEWLDLGRALIEQAIGRVERASDTWGFEETRYYEREMGHPLLRVFVTIGGVRGPGELARLKLATNELEREAAGVVSEVERPINLDIGHLGLSQVVLASTKHASHRVYIASGIYAEVTLRYVRGTLEALPWTYADYRRREYHEFFLAVRRDYKNELEANARGSGRK